MDRDFFKLINDNFNIETDEFIENKILNFKKLFLKFNSHTNLMSKKDTELFLKKHFYDSLSLILFLKKYNLYEKYLKVMDLGTGGGLPAIPLSICFNFLEILAIDSTEKKINFINNTSFSLRLNNIAGKCARIENLGFDLKNYSDINVSRALAPLNILLELSIPYLKVNGYFIAYKAKNIDKEIMLSKIALKKLHCEIIDKIDYKLPLSENYERSLIVIKKLGNTNLKYPRKFSDIKNNPL